MTPARVLRLARALLTEAWWAPRALRRALSGLFDGLANAHPWDTE